MSYSVPVTVFLFSQTSWLVSFSLSRLNLMKDQFSVFVVGVICLVLITLGPFLAFRRYFRKVDPLMYANRAQTSSASRRMQIVCHAVVILVLSAVPGWVQGQVVLSFVNSELTVDEGKQFNARIYVTGSNEKPFVVIVQVQNDNGDFVGDTQVALFPKRASGSSVQFTVRDDNIPEGPEVYYLRMRVLDKSIYIGSPSEMQVTIPANDDAYGVFSLDKVPPMVVAEHSYNYTVRIKVKREVSAYGSVNVTFRMKSSSPADGDVGLDILPFEGRVTFQPQETEAYIELQVLADDVPENNETFFIYLILALPQSRINKSLFEVVIAANDAPVRLMKNNYRFDEGPGTKIVTVDVTRGIMDDGVTLVGPINFAVGVDYNFVDGNATFYTDFMATNGTLVFPPGETKQSISFTILDDTVLELEEYFSVRLLNLKGEAVFIAPSVATVTINANDHPNGIIEFKADPTGVEPLHRVNEDSSTSVTILVERNGGTFGKVTVDWVVLRQMEGIFPVSDDLGPDRGTLTFADGVNEAPITLTVVQDNLPEPIEVFIIILNPRSVTGNAVVEGLTEVRLLIEDSDNFYGIIEFGPTSSQKLITNQSPRLLQLSVTRTGGTDYNLDANVTVTYDDGTHDIDNEDVFVSSSSKITIPTGETKTTVNIELQRSIFLAIGGEFEAIITDLKLRPGVRYGSYNSPKFGTRQKITVVVSQDEASGETGFFNTTNQVVDEPESGVTEVTFLVSREGLSGQANVRWTISGKDVTADDVEALQGTLTMQPGMSEAFLVIGIKADDIPEVTEYLNVTLVSIEPSDTQRLRAGSTTEIITVNANDNPGGVLQFSPMMNLSYTISEGNAPIQVIVERSGSSLVQVEVQYSIIPDGASQFYGSTNMLRFPPGWNRASSQIMAVKDGIPELTQKYTLILIPAGNPPSVLGNFTSIELIIIDSDNPYGVIHFSADSTTIFTDESQLGEQKNISVVVQRSDGDYGTITVPWSLSPAPQNDLIPSSGVIVFQPGQDEQNISLILKNDDIPEGDETYALQLSTPEGGALLGTPTVVTLVIQENDNPVEFPDPIKYVTEPQTVSLVIRRQGRLDKQSKLDKQSIVHYRTLDGSASYTEGDYMKIQPQEVAFEVGQQEIEIMVSVLDDNVPERNETVLVQLFGVGDKALSVSVTMALSKADEFQHLVS